MASFFGNQRPAGVPSPRVIYTSRYTTARMNLLLVVACTAINVILALTGGSVYFLFSASIPYQIAVIGAILCGQYPEVSAELGLTRAELFPTSALIGVALVALGLLAVYLLCFALSKKRAGWLIAALVFFCIDTFFMFFMLDFSDFTSFIDIAFHGWVIVELALGLHAHKKLRILPEDDGIPYLRTDTAPAQDPTAGENTFPDAEAKSDSTSEDASEDANGTQPSHSDSESPVE